jgi:pimeloyl-ACP methyl ester carboxylesterase
LSTVPARRVDGCLSAAILRRLADMADIVTPSGQRLHAEDEGRGPPVLLVHGWAMASAALGPLASRLGAGRRTVRYDLRGHGASAPASSATLDDHAADLADLMEQLALDGALVVAWSLGAQVLIRALPAARGRIRAAVLVGATPRFTTGDGWSHGLPARTVAPAIAERELLGPSRLAAIDAVMPLPDTAAALAGLEVLATADLRPELGAVGIPILVLHGDADPICMPGASLALAEAIPGARRVLLAGAGHAPFLTREEEVAGAVLDFAREIA